jgi:hypothetical protein
MLKVNGCDAVLKGTYRRYLIRAGIDIVLLPLPPVSYPQLWDYVIETAPREFH